MRRINLPPTVTEAPRQRNAAATRAAILASGRSAFTKFGYDGVGVREIAQGAGVTAMLVNRYFGSKEQLFAEVVQVAYADKGILTEDVTKPDRNLKTFSQDLADALVGKTTPGAAPLDGFLLMLRSASNPVAAEIVRHKVEEHFEKPLAALLRGEMPNERAALVLSLIAGFQVMRQLILATTLAKSDPSKLSGELAMLIDHLIEPHPPRKSAASRSTRSHLV